MRSECKSRLKLDYSCAHTCVGRLGLVDAQSDVCTWCACTSGKTFCMPQTPHKNDDNDFLDELTVTCGVLIYTSCAPRTLVGVTLSAGRPSGCVHSPRDKAIGNNTPLQKRNQNYFYHSIEFFT